MFRKLFSAFQGREEELGKTPEEEAVKVVTLNPEKEEALRSKAKEYQDRINRGTSENNQVDYGCRIILISMLTGESHQFDPQTAEEELIKQYGEEFKGAIVNAIGVVSAYNAGETEKLQGGTGLPSQYKH